MSESKQITLPKPAYVPTPEELEGNRVSYCYMGNEVIPMRSLPQTGEHAHPE